VLKGNVGGVEFNLDEGVCQDLSLVQFEFSDRESGYATVVRIRCRRLRQPCQPFVVLVAVFGVGELFVSDGDLGGFAARLFVRESLAEQQALRRWLAKFPDPHFAAVDPKVLSTTESANRQMNIHAFLAHLSTPLPSSR
jgi:hypothetical protein